ncbi:MAG TPA: quinol:cytochrome C oxidoreductase, partial [Bacteroidia bacterium]|nr:quinol:cytochrome C oxidoreductase [Bacteroidia bacterium]
SAMTTIILFVIYLKRKGYLPQVNDSHIHDLGKWVFAISFLWSYLWFCQFMLIWYTNIPEEIIYFHDRLHSFGYMGLMWTVFAMNFAFPMILLMSRDSKRNFVFLVIVGSLIFIGHWLDVYMMVMPGTVHAHHSLGWMEIGTALGFLGLMLFVVHKALAKRPLMVEKHPYLDESLHHHY